MRVAAWPASRLDVTQRQALAAAAVFVVAALGRLSMVYLRGGSLADSPSYDTGVYYAAADGLVHGRLPYRDFTLVHPPGMMLALTPFAVLGRLTTDHIGFAVGDLAWMVLGAANAVLILCIARRLQLSVAASTIGALTYALWYESLRTEYAVHLEPLGNFLVLLGILAFVTSSQITRRWVPVACGAALGVAASVKIWYAVPLVVVLAWHAAERRGRSPAAWAVVGAGAGLVAVDGPFFLVDPRAMWRMVVVDQFGRSFSSGNPIRRLANIASDGQTTARTPVATATLIACIGGVVLLSLCVLAWRGRAGRLCCVLLASQVAVLLSAPSFFLCYADYLAPALSATAAAAAGRLLDGRIRIRSVSRRRLLVWAAWTPALAVAIGTAAIDGVHPMLAVSPAPDRTVQAALASARCVQSDTPMALIQLDVLSRDFDNGCQVWVDVIGRTYEAPLKPTGVLDGRPMTRRTYLPWQRALLRYLLSGSALVVVDPHAAGIAPATLRALERGRQLAAADGYAPHAASTGTAVIDGQERSATAR